jgi:hypothetical protein
VLGDLLDQINAPLSQVSTDGAYDSFKNYNLLEKQGAKITIPPRENAKIRQPEKLVVLRGRGKMVITAEVWLRQQCFVLNRFLVIIYVLSYLKAKRLNHLSNAMFLTR